ncbi:hemin-degrading factor [Caenispirillum bisanense]|uniref:Putative hemin transport protein n=1 Tax=Caenispirillum bisanense TaxID=414052 RepID=A0A286GRM8_9PROT|nr:ChuX/HutX family heme-like substrate-binding protein [Caenispirillum bisanense]SOD98193.1 putative hemin transport protein [Caenispirillum bisanense]
MTMHPASLAALSEAWSSVHAGTAEQRPRDLAASLGHPEAQLVAAGSPATGVRRLEGGRWAELIHALPEVGEVMVLTRNDHAVHEKTGCFGNVRGMGGAMLVLNDAVDLRLFLSVWHSGFDVTTTGLHGERRSLQIFDVHGDAVIKIYRTANTDAAAFDALCGRFHDAEAGPALLTLDPAPARDLPPPDDAVDMEVLRTGWRDLQDVHDFRRLLKDAGASRHQALRLIGPEFAEEVTPDALSRTLTLAADQAVPIMVFVGNRGCVQIHSGPVKKIVEMRGWTNVLDPGFNLHVVTAATATAWVVRKPQADGVVTALELYDADGRNFAILYGVRPAGVPESDAWRAVLETLPRLPEGGRTAAA